MQLQDTARPPKTKYRGADWQKIQDRWGRTRTADHRAAAEAAPRLGLSTHFARYPDAVHEYPGPSYLATLKGYGPNGGKLILRTVHEQPCLYKITKPEDLKPRPKYGTPRADADPINLMKSAMRARSDVEDWVRMMCLPDTDYRLVTLSKRNGLPTLTDAWAAVAEFRRLLAKHYPDVKALAVPERHFGGGANHLTYHVHCILIFPGGTRPLYTVFHRIWYKALGATGNEKGAATPGNCDFARTHAKDGTRYTPCQAARYLAKYLTKDMTAGSVGQKRFTKSHGSPDPVKRYYWQPIAASHDMTRAHAVSLLRKFFPADTYAILSRSFHSGGDTYHVFSAEPVPS